MIPFTLSAIGFLLLAYAIHHAHKRDRAALVAAHAVDRAELVKEHDDVTEIRDLLHAEGIRMWREKCEGLGYEVNALTTDLAQTRATLYAAERQCRDNTITLNMASAEIARLTLSTDAPRPVAPVIPIKRDGWAG